MPSSPRRSKRPFQPCITSFFDRRDKDDAVTPTTSSKQSTTSSNFPSIPVTVQSSLLNVGMRVRKAVPEGYKTFEQHGKRYQGLPYDRCLDSSSTLHVEKYSPRARPRPWELTPFCGIHKVGGMAVQQMHGDHDYLPALGFDEEGFMGSSQESQASIVPESTPGAHPLLFNTISKKRQFDCEEGQGAAELQIFEDADNHMMHTLSYPASQSTMPNLHSLRPLAHPKSRRRTHGAESCESQGYEDQENIWSVLPTPPIDFDEADFLHPPPNEYREIQMSGM